MDSFGGALAPPLASIGYNSRIRVAWIPAEVLIFGSTPVISPSSPRVALQLEEGSSAVRSGKSQYSSGADANVLHVAPSGFERRLQAAMAQRHIIPMKMLRSAFPAACEHYREDAELNLSFEAVADLQPARWENLHPHEGVGAVVLVLNCHRTAPLASAATDPPSMGGVGSAAALGGVGEFSLPDAASCIAAVKSLFATRFKRSVCRCVVVDPPSSIRSLISSNNFFVAASSAPVEDVSATLLLQIGAAIVHYLYSKVTTLTASSVNSSQFRTPLDESDTLASGGGGASNAGTSGGGGGSSGENTRKLHMPSRLTKQRGDVLLQLGVVEGSISSLRTVQLAADPLWCGATLESLAAARYAQNRQLLFFVRDASRSFRIFASDSTQWGPSLLPLVQAMETVVSKMQAGLHKSVSGIRSSTVTSSVKQRLMREIHDPAVEKCTQLLTCLATMKKDLAVVTDTNYEMLYSLASVSGTAKTHFEAISRLAFAELELYLSEALVCLRGLARRLYDREAKVLTQLSVLYSLQGQQQKFLSTVSALRSTLKNLPVCETRKAMYHLPALCRLCGCTRKASMLMINAAAEERKAQNYIEAVALLVRTARWIGVPLFIPELLAMVGESADGIYVSDDADGGQPFALGDADEALQLLGERSDGILTAELELAKRTLQELELAALEKRNLRQRRVPDRVPGTAPNVSLKLSHVRVLKELLDVLTEANWTANGIRCHVASLLVFHYASFLDRHAQQTLLRIMDQDATLLQPHVPPIRHLPSLFSNIEVLPLPPHLAPKTIPLSGAQFTFIDREQLKMTVLSMNGKRLDSSIVWCAGDVGTVRFTVTNPLQHYLQLTSLALHCHQHHGGGHAQPAEGAISPIHPVVLGGAYDQDSDSHGSDDDEIHEIPGDYYGSRGEHRVSDWWAPVSYVEKGVVLQPQSVTELCLYVEPRQEGILSIDAIEVRLGQMHSCAPVVVRLPAPILTPVMRPLPTVECSLSRNAMDLFGGQSSVVEARLTNTSCVAIDKLRFSVHGPACQLVGCEGCLERVSARAVYAQVDRTDESAHGDTPSKLGESGLVESLAPGERITINVTLTAPVSAESESLTHVLFRVDYSVNHDKPEPPPEVPSAIPVFAVVPHRVMETKFRLRNVPSLTISSLTLSKDRRFVEGRVRNRSTQHTIVLMAGALMSFVGLRDVSIGAGTEYMLPPIEISKVIGGQCVFAIPWALRDAKSCRGTVTLDLSFLEQEVLCTEPLEDAVVHVQCDLDGDLAGIWGNLVSLSHPLCIPVVRPVQLTVTISAPWRATLPLRVRIGTESFADVAMLSGPVDTVTPVGQNTSEYCELFELVVFKPGEHIVTLTLSDQDHREIVHSLRLQVEHSSG